MQRFRIARLVAGRGLVSLLALARMDMSTTPPPPRSPPEAAAASTSSSPLADVHVEAASSPHHRTYATGTAAKAEHTRSAKDASRDTTDAPVSQAAGSGEDRRGGDGLAAAELEPIRWVQKPYEDPDTAPIIDDKGEYIVSRVQWPTGEIAYTTPPPVDDRLAPRFGYNVVQVKKHVSWWKYNQKYPRLSLAYINIQVLFLLGLAWLAAFLTTEHRRTTEAMKTPGAMVGEHRGRGPPTSRTQKVAFSTEEMSAMVDRAQNNWLDGSAEANYIGSKDYRMKAIPRPKEFTVDDFRKR